MCKKGMKLKMEILYISSVPSYQQFNYMKKRLRSGINNVKYGMQESGYKFHHLIMNGIINERDNFIYSIIGRPTNIKTHKGIIWKKSVENEENIIYDHLGYLNIPVIKNIIISFKCFFKTLSWIIKNQKKEKCIIIDASYISVIPFINFATKIKKCKKIAIVCDIYEYMAEGCDAREKKSKVHKIIAKVMKKNYDKIDGFVFLTEAMNDILNRQKKPYIIMEGLVDINMKLSKNDLNTKNPKDIVMYAGAIREKYGLKNLVQGYHMYKNDNSELWIYGSGDFVPEVEKMRKKDKRIKYYGIVSNKEIIQKELEVTILINPRSSDLEFTKYSFPSKNMEYMVSGTPILTTNLPGMPSEYKKYVYLIENNSPKGICTALERTISLGKKELHKKGKLAKVFVMKEKNNMIQAARIIKLCREVIDIDNK